jgi:hypothetical protein
MTYYCKLHPDWEGADKGKVNDHLEVTHHDDFQGKTIEEAKATLRNLFKEVMFEIPGPTRLGDQQWLARYHGRPPKIGNLVGDNQKE